MTKVATFVLTLLVILPKCSVAQGPCPISLTPKVSTRSGRLICLVPQVYGPGGLVGFNENGPLLNTTASGTSHDVDFEGGFNAKFTPLNSAIGAQLSQLPLAAPVSGLVFSFNPSTGVVTEITQNMGPILSERPSTVGRHKLFVGVSYQYFNFDKIDGANLKSFGAVLEHEKGGLPACPSGDGCFHNLPLFAQDIVSSQNRIDLKIHQVTAVADFGLSDRLDVSIAIPILSASMSMVTTATIHSFETYNPNIDSNSCFADPLNSPPNNTKGCMHQFANPANTGQPLVPGEKLLTPSAYPFLQNVALFTSSGSASGIGDVVLRGKYQAIKAEKLGLAMGLDVHLPTGDAQNYLGAGTWGIRPFASVAYSGRIAPHGSIGFQVNGDSILAGDVTTNTKKHLPNVFSYDAGVDAGVTKRLSLSADLLGLTLIDQFSLSRTSFTDHGGNSYSDIETTRKNTNQLGLALGGKIKPFGKLIVTADVLFRVNDAGLHSKPVPLIGLSYTF